MITKELVERINTLARKQRTSGLTAVEKQEQQQLRKTYLAGIRQQVIAQLGPTPKRKGHAHTDSCSCGCSHHKNN